MRSLVQRLLPALLCLLALALSATPALAARGHVFSKEFGKAGSGPGQFKEPSGVAVNESTADIYVVDKGNNRVERFNSAGVFQSEVTGPSTTGNGTVTSGSATIEGVTTTGFFSKGEEVTGVGLAPGTTIVNVGVGSLEVSPAAEASGSELSETLTAHQSFSEPEGIAVDNSCFLNKTPTQETECKEADPSAGDVYVADAGHAAVDKFTATGVYLGQITETPGGAGGRFLSVLGVAVGATGELWVTEEHSPNEGGIAVTVADNFSDSVANPFVASRLLPKEGGNLRFGFVVPGLALDSQDNLYQLATSPGTNRERGEFWVGEFNREGAGLQEAVDEEPSSAVAVELSTDDVYVDNIATVARFGPKGEEIERLTVPGAHGSGVAVSSAAEAVYVADSSTGVIDVYTRQEPGAPTIESEGLAGAVSSDRASLTAQVNPRGAPTEYRFEYGTSASYGSSAPVPDASIGSGYDVHAVGVELQGLTAGTTYHFRVVAHNANGTVVGADQTFTTETAGGPLVLPDGRQWEMVSPPEKQGTQLEPIGENGVIQASAGGDALTYFAASPTEPQPQGDTNFVQVLSTRSGAGWGTQDLTVPHEVNTGKALGTNGEFPFFSEDLSLAVAQPLGPLDHAISEEATEQTAFLRSDYLNGNPAEQCTPPLMHCYRPLVTAAAGHQDVPAGTVFGEEQKCSPTTEGHEQAFSCGPRFAGASPDAAHVILTSHVSLTTDPGQLAGGNNLYEWSAGALRFIGVGLLGLKGESERHAVSNDGSRVIFESNAPSEGHEGLLLRDTASGHTLQLDAAEPGCPEPQCTSGEGRFQIASGDGSRVFFTDKARLTKDSGGGVTGASVREDLYEYDLNAPEGHRLTDLTPLGAGEEPAAVQGGVLGASEDGSSIYYVANGKLTPEAVQGTCGSNGNPRAELCNLYTRHFNGAVWEAPRLIAVLSGEDGSDWNLNLNAQPARVSPDGGWLAFMSQRPLTGYDNRDAVSGKPDQEVYLYHATGAGKLVCASCDPTGARPAGVEYSHLDVQLVGGAGVWKPSTWIAANIPGWTPYAVQHSLHQSRYLSDSGRLFFNSPGALVPQDVNNTQDVYEYEPEGLSGCSTASTTFSGRSGGCVSLISSGSSSEESAFLDASETGGDVFFLTASKLSPQDHDTALDVYDAHECTSASPCIPPPAAQPPPCITEASCKTAPTPQPGFPSAGAGTAAVFGEDNLTAPAFKPSVKPKSLTRAQKLAKALSSCRKKYKKSKQRRAACERQARKQYRAKAKAKKASTYGRAK
jgi:hypothetical protein